MSAKTLERPETDQDLKIRPEVFVATLAHIEVYPEHHDQGMYRCDSAYCFAGWSIQAAGFKWVSLDPDDSAVEVPIAQIPKAWSSDFFILESNCTASIDVDYAAYIALGISHSQGHSANGRWLFSPGNSLDQLYSCCADLLGIKVTTLRRKVRRYIKENKLRDYVAKPRVVTARS